MWTLSTDAASAPSVEGSNSSNGSVVPPDPAKPSSGTVSTAGTVSTPPRAATGAFDGVPSYSPSSVELFLRCPMLWYLQRLRGWAPRVEEWTPNRAVGSAVASGLAIQRRVGVGQRPPSSEALQGALASLQEAWQEQDQWELPVVEKLVARGLTLACEGPQTIGMVRALLIEEPVYGRKPDVVWRDTEGRVVVDDDKVVVSLDARWESERLAEYDHSWQFRDYAHHVGVLLSEPVYQVRAHLIVLGPRKHVTLHPMTYSRDVLDRWYRSALSVWETMHAIEERAQPAWQNLLVCTDRHTHFGQRCPMYDACHVYGCDEGQMEALYERAQKEGI